VAGATLERFRDKSIVGIIAFCICNRRAEHG
jgi:hypothetical protein